MKWSKGIHKTLVSGSFSPLIGLVAVFSRLD
jgi:hypothetical protein